MNHIEILRFPELDYSAAEAMNTLCTNISYSGANIKTILITSRYDREGKTFVAMNLMRAMARLQKKVVMLDGDLRRSGVAGQFRLHFDKKHTNGLAQYLAGMCPMEDILYETGIPNAYLVPVGREVLNSLQLLNSPQMPKLMESLRERFDLVLVDTPPAGVIVDAIDMARYCDGSILVVSYKRGKQKDIVDIRNMIDKTGCKVLGVVMNNGGQIGRHYQGYSAHSGNACVEEVIWQEDDCSGHWRKVCSWEQALTLAVLRYWPLGSWPLWFR